MGFARGCHTAGLGVLAAAGCVLAGAAPALAASTVTASGSITYTGDAGVNTVTVSDAVQGTGTRVTFAETDITAQAGCVQQGVNGAYCDIADFNSTFLSLGANNDKATLNTSRVTYFVSGQGGNDQLFGSDVNLGFESLDGGEGADRLFGRAGNDELSGAEGNGDVVDGGAGEDTLLHSDEDGSNDVSRGGPGFDRVNSSFFGPDPAPGVTIDLAAGTAQFPGLPVHRLESVENATGDDGPDRLFGSAGPNELDGDEQADTLDGRAGPDRLEGDSGNDRLEGRDGFADLLMGGGGTDICDADQLDARELCETGALVNVPPFGSVFGDRRPARCATRGAASRPKARTIARRGFAFRATCDEAGRLAARLVGQVKGRFRLARAGALELAGRSVRVTAGRQVRMRLRVTRRLRRLVRRGARLRLELTSTDAAGNERTTSRKVRLR